ncbi:MAG: CaiB/BaiF CoA-transferase family protein [Ahrensia sp.]|nr:CaiB/BaiF CoA-transferase family protein [Ahrensia sp.]
MSGPLVGLKVVDLSRILAGPTMTQILADLGAEVIKIERPGKGDDTRQWGPPWLKDQDGNDTAEAGYYLSANRGKHSVELDITTQEGADTVRRMVAEADFFVENFKVGGLKKYGLDYESLSAINPGLIYLSITGFGQTGPDAAQPGYDYLIQARSGLMSITGDVDGGPMRVGVGICDLQTGLMGGIGVLAALYHREKAGEGQHIDIALLDTQVAMLVNQGFNYLVTGKAPGRTGAWHPNLAPYQPFPTATDDIIIAVGNDSQFIDMCRVMNLPDLASDERFKTNPLRNINRDALADLIAKRSVEQPAAHWLKVLPANNVPACPINDIAQTFADEQIKARGVRLELDHPIAGKVPGIANPLKFSKTPIEYKKGPPVLGEDTEAVLERYGGKG